MNHTREPKYEKSVRGFPIHKATTKLANYEPHKRAHIREIRSWILNSQSDDKLSNSALYYKQKNIIHAKHQNQSWCFAMNTHG